MVSMEQFASAFGIDTKSDDVWTTLGKVTAVNGDGTLSVMLGGSSSASTCDAYCVASVDDVVFVVITGGRARAIAVRGGKYLPITGGTLTGTLTTPEITYSATNADWYFATPNGARRLALTGANNLRIDTWDSTANNGNGDWATHGYVYHSGVERTANTVLAAPNGSNGGASFRKLVAADVTGLGDTAKGADQSAIDSSTSSVSTTSETTKNLDSIVLAPGTWLVTYSVEFASNANGRRVMTLTTNTTSISSTPVYMVSCAPANGLATNLSRTQLVINSGTSNITRYLNAYQNSGSALNCRSCIQAVRIA